MTYVFVMKLWLALLSNDIIMRFLLTSLQRLTYARSVIFFLRVSNIIIMCVTHGDYLLTEDFYSLVMRLWLLFFFTLRVSNRIVICVTFRNVLLTFLRRNFTYVLLMIWSSFFFLLMLFQRLLLTCDFIFTYVTLKIVTCVTSNRCYFRDCYLHVLRFCYLRYVRNFCFRCF